MLAAGATGLGALTAGCLGFALGNEPLEFDAARVEPSGETLESTGYAETDVERERIEETVEVAGVSREVRASFWTAVYEKTVEIEDIESESAVFAAVSTPAMEVLGQEFNPLADLDDEELLVEFLGEAGGEFDDLGELSPEESFEHPILGAEREVTVFTGSTEPAGELEEELEVDLLVTSFDHADDFLVLVGGHPRLDPEERFNIEDLLASVDHPLE